MNMSSRTKNVVRNTGWGAIQKVVMLIMPFVTRTALIKVLGVEYLGLSSLFTSILTLLSMAELGISSAIISVMYKPIAEKNTQLICALMGFYRKAYCFIGIITTITGLLLLPFLPKFINGSIPDGINIIILYLIYLINNSLSYFLFAYKNCLFIAHQRNDINSKIQTIVIFFQNVLQLGLLLLFRNYYCFAIVIPICSVIINITTAYFASRHYPEYVCKGKLNKEVKKELQKKVIGLLFGRISSTIRGSVDSLFISAFLGLEMVAIYSNYFYIVTAVVGIIMILENSLAASIGNSLVTETVEKNHNDFSKFTFYLQWIVSWCSICILCLEQPFMRLWVGEKFMLNNGMVVLCAVYLFVNCICLIRSIYTQALGMWWQLRYLSMADIFVNIFVNFVLVKFCGVYGIIGATILDIVFVSIPWTTYYLFKDYFGRQYYFKYLCSYIRYFLVMLIVGGITGIITSMIIIDSMIVELCVKSVLCIFVPNLLYLAVYRKNKHLRGIFGMLKK